MHRNLGIALSVSTVAACGGWAAEKPLPAFPGAEGWGSDTPGGRGGKVMIVTNLNPDGPGSLQEACAAAGPRIVVFEVSGVISNTITIENSNITIAGQTAPGAGITIEGMLVSKSGISDIVARFLRVRPRPVDEQILPDKEGGGALATRLRKIGVEMKNPHENWFAEYDGIKMSSNSWVVLDHVSCSWSRDAVTRRTIEEVRSGTGDYGRREPKGGLMEGLTPGAAPLDTDKDGMPDEWEKKNGLDPSQDDAAKVMPGGYAAIEVYANERADALVREATAGDKRQGNHAQQQR